MLIRVREMVDTGRVRRKIDSLGRVVVPLPMRRVLGMEDGTPVEFCTDGDAIVLRVTGPKCVFCGFTGDVRGLMGRRACGSCVRELVARSGR